MEPAKFEAVYFLNSDSSTYFFRLVIRGSNSTCWQSNILRQDFILFIEIVYDNVSTPTRTSYVTFYGLNYFSQTVTLLARHAFVPVRSGELRDEPKESSEFVWKNIVIDHVLLISPKDVLISRELREKFRNWGHGDICRALSSVILR